MLPLYLNLFVIHTTSLIRIKLDMKSLNSSSATMAPNMAVVNSVTGYGYGFWITSSPLYPKDNGKAEKKVQIVNNPLRKASNSNTDSYLASLSYKATSLECGASSDELLMHRKLRATLSHVAGRCALPFALLATSAPDQHLAWLISAAPQCSGTRCFKKRVQPGGSTLLSGVS